jgi:hypothetical protein
MPDLSVVRPPGGGRILEEPSSKSATTAEDEASIDEFAETVDSSQTEQEMGEGILDEDPITAIFLEQQAEREALRRKRRSKQQG